MPLLYEIPFSVISRISSGEAEVVGALIKEVASGKILAHVQPTQGFFNAISQVSGSIAQTGFSPLGVAGIVQGEQIKSGIASLEQGMGLLQNLQFANMALTGIGVGVSVAGFAAVNMRLSAIERNLGTLREEVREIGSLIQATEIRRLFSEIRSALKDLDSVTTRKDHLALASSLQRQLSSHVSSLNDLLVEAMDIRKETSLPLQRLDLIWTLSSAKWLCEDAELRALFVSEDLAHADEYAARYIDDNLKCLDQLNPDALTRLVASGEKDLKKLVAKRREAAVLVGGIANGFARAVENLGQQQSLSRALVEDGTSGRTFIQAASKETKSQFLVVMP
tara:strand:+ start:427 stop:1434 length:1008 start_codon:yes stop_codon:yes gene_type:complete